MKKTFLTFLMILTFTGCVMTENRLVKVRRSPDDLRQGISIINTATQPWWAPTTAGVPDDKNPWLKFVKSQPNPYDPWGNDPLTNYGVEPLSVQLSRVKPSSEAKVKSGFLLALEKERAKNKELIRVMREALKELQNSGSKTQKVY